jgi:thiol:disulfide interchange protein
VRGVRRGTAAIAGAVAVLLLGGCVTVYGPAPQRGAPGDAATPGAARGAGQVGYAHPFQPLPSVSPAPVPDGYDSSADAGGAVSAALTAAAKDGRPVLLDFGSSWCEDCQALSALVDSPGVNRILARNYHLVTVDVGHFDRNTQLASRYVSLAQSGIPALVLLGPDGTRRDTGDPGEFANARNLDADGFAATLVDWLYQPSR